MSDMLVVQFNEDDKELGNAIKESFGDQAEFVRPVGFDTAEAVMKVLLPIVPILAQFLLAHFAQSKKDEGDDSNKPAKRVVVSKDGKEIAIEAETIEDVERILSRL